VNQVIQLSADNTTQIPARIDKLNTVDANHPAAATDIFVASSEAVDAATATGSETQ